MMSSRLMPKLFACKVMQTNCYMCSLTIKKFESHFLAANILVGIEFSEGKLIDIVVSVSKTCLERERFVSAKYKIS